MNPSASAKSAINMRASAPRGGAAQRYGVLTMHRPSNVDGRARFEALVEGLAVLAQAASATLV